MELVYKAESYNIVGACFEVYREKGCGFLEAVYQECLELEFGMRELPFSSQAVLRLEYKGQPLKQYYTPDFLCYEKIVLEIKAVSNLTDDHRAKVHNYLKAADMKLAILANFGHYPKLEYQRIVY